VLSLFAEFIANDKPIMASYKGEMLFPDLPGLSGGEVRRLPLPLTDYRDPYHRRGDQRERLDDLAADPLLTTTPTISICPTPAPRRRPGC
jgi:ABC-type microcin C transport system permease subunit YejE